MYESTADSYAKMMDLAIELPVYADALAQGHWSLDGNRWNVLPDQQLFSLLGACFRQYTVPGTFRAVFLAELSFTLWLIVKGVDVAKWEERARVKAG